MSIVLGVFSTVLIVILSVLFRSIDYYNQNNDGFIKQSIYWNIELWVQKVLSKRLSVILNRYQT